ncbi:MAG TPA: hypothetical protein VLP43_12050 [Solirubrobacteraceae bacterium]|nr:hypothetical protein [Solirubrobacteraceae bacterium]
MPDRDGNVKASEETVPDTSLHAYKEGRRDEVKGDVDKLESTDPHDHQDYEGEGELELPKQKH